MMASEPQEGPRESCASAVTEFPAPNVILVTAATQPNPSFCAPKVMAEPATTDPVKTASAPKVMAVPAITDPSKITRAPVVSVVPRAHKMFSTWAPLTSRIVQSAPRSMVEEAWKRKTELGSSCPSKVTVEPATMLMKPVRQVPAVKVKLPISLTISVESSRISSAASKASKMETPS
jgi:hypothetical protein